MYRVMRMQRCNFLIDTLTTSYSRTPLERGIKRRIKNQLAERNERERDRVLLSGHTTPPLEFRYKKRSFFGINNSRLNNYSARMEFLSFWYMGEERRRKWTRNVRRDAHAIWHCWIIFLYYHSNIFSWSLIKNLCSSSHRTKNFNWHTSKYYCV